MCSNEELFFRFDGHEVRALFTAEAVRSQSYNYKRLITHDGENSIMTAIESIYKMKAAVVELQRFASKNAVVSRKAQIKYDLPKYLYHMLS
jgi:hypothetical protein